MLKNESFNSAGVSSNQRQRAERLQSIAGVALIFIGALVLIGWLFDIAVLKSIRPGFASMKSTTALCIALSGMALLQLKANPATVWARRIGVACASAAALICLLTLAAWLGGWGVDVDVMRIAVSAQATHHAGSGSMSPSSASAMLCGNVALLLLDGSNARRWRFAAAASLSTVTLLLGLFGAAAYASIVPVYYAWGQGTGMALHSALAFVLLGFAGVHIAWVSAGWKWSIGAPVIAASALGMCVLVGLNFESFRSMRNYVDSSHSVDRSQEVRTVISDLNAAYAIALSGERGFVITGQEEMLAPDAGNGRAESSRLRLQALTADNPGQQAQLVELDSLAKQKLDFFRQVVDAKRTEGTESAARLIGSGRGESLVAAIYTITRDMDRAEQELLAQRKARLATSIEQTLFILPAGTLAALALFLGALLHLNAEATERRRVTAAIGESEARFRSLVQATSQIVWRTDAAGQVNGSLPAWQGLTGQNDEDVQGAGWMNAVHPEDRSRTASAWAEAVKTRAPFDVDYRIRRYDGIYRDFHARGVTVLNRDSTVREWVGTCSDVTDSRADEIKRKRAEDDVRQLNAELDQRVVTRTAQLEAANRELEAFTYSVSHDLRAPLRGVDSFSRMVIEDYGPQLDDEGRRMLNVVRSESQRMGHLIDDLLAFSRVGRVDMRRELIDMTDLVLSVIHKLDITPERRAQITLLALPDAYGDRNLIRQVWVNLLSNALKFSSQKALPKIEIGALITDGNCVYHVLDNGAGFDPRYLHKLFGVFQRLHTEEEFEGTGVGLALVQRIVQRHGGTVRAQGEVDQGATFYFALPVVEESQA